MEKEYRRIILYRDVWTRSGLFPHAKAFIPLCVSWDRPFTSTTPVPLPETSCGRKRKLRSIQVRKPSVSFGWMKLSHNTLYDFDNDRYRLGSDLAIGNMCSMDYARPFYEGMREVGQENSVSLLRCAWARIQRHGALVLTDVGARLLQGPTCEAALSWMLERGESSYISIHCR